MKAATLLLTLACLAPCVAARASERHGTAAISLEGADGRDAAGEARAAYVSAVALPRSAARSEALLRARQALREAIASGEEGLRGDLEACESALRAAAGDLLAEASAMGEQARGAYAETLGERPSVARNARLEAVRRLLRRALERYRLVAELLPEHDAEIAPELTDLQGLLFWCNKGMVLATR